MREAHRLGSRNRKKGHHSIFSSVVAVVLAFHVEIPEGASRRLSRGIFGGMDSSGRWADAKKPDAAGRGDFL